MSCPTGRTWLVVLCVGAFVASSGPGWAQTTQPAVTAAPPVTARVPATGPSDVLRAIPADAWGFVVIRNMQGLSNKIAALGQQLSLPVPAILPMLKGLTGILVGLDDSGSLAVVVTDPSKFSPPVGLLVPVTDLQAMLQPLGPQDVGDGVQQISFMGQPSFVVPFGRYAVIAPAKELAVHLAKLTGGVAGKLDPSRQAAYDNADIFAHVELASFIKHFRPKAEQMLETVPPEARGGFGPLFELADQVEAADLAIRLDSRGLMLRGFLSFLPGSELAGQMAKQRPTDQPLLIGLPARNESYIVACADTNVEPAAERASVQRALDNAFSQPHVQQQLIPEQLQKLKQAAVELTGMLYHTSISISALAPGGQDGMVGLAVACRVSDAPKVLTLIRQSVSAVQQMFKDEQAREALAGLQYKPAAEQIGQVSVDHVFFDLAGFEQISEQDRAQIDKILGREGLLLRIAAVDKTHVAIAFGGGSERFARILELVKQQQSPLSKDRGIARVAARLPRRRTGEAYIAVDHLLQLIKDIATAVGQPESVPFQVRPINAPLGFSSSAARNYARIDVFVPIELIVAVKDLFMQLSGAPPMLPPPTTLPVPTPTF